MAYQTPQEESFQEDAELATLFQEDAEFTPFPQEEVGLAILLGFSPLQTYILKSKHSKVEIYKRKKGRF